MKKLMILVVFLSACGSGPADTNTVSTPTATTLSPTSPAAVTPSTPSNPSPSPSSTPTPVVCSTFANGKWVANAPAIVDTFNNQVGTFIENYNGFQCTRTLSDGVPNGDPLSLVFPDAVGSPCNNVPGWIQFEITSCNKMLVLFRDGSGTVVGSSNYNAE